MVNFAKGCFKAIEDAKNYDSNLTEIKIDKVLDLETEIETLFKKHQAVDGIIAIDNISGVIALNTVI
ncbi:hypothetical protein [Lacinutrix sp.]|uniref:hypothetical protein n=1 Tax=Lacinutrix sp. TaxID=1937692 RepID=UPI0025C0D75A|nr:hypothetical protein [Lacinutrix sp.]